MTILGSRIEKERIGCGLSREELAQRLNVKNEELISWEEGRSYPQFHACQKLAKILNIPRKFIMEDTMYQKVLYEMEPVLSSPKQRWTQLLILCILAIVQFVISYFSLLEGTDILFFVQSCAILFYIVGIVLTVNNKMRPYSTGWFIGIPFLFIEILYMLIMMPKYRLFAMISIPIAFVFSVGMIAVFYFKISKFWYYVIQVICWITIVGGIVFMFLAARSLVLIVVFSSLQTILLTALFRLQLQVYYNKRNWLANDLV